MGLWAALSGSSSDTNSSTVCRLLFYILTSANRIPHPAGAPIVEHYWMEEEVYKIGS